MTHGSLFTGIAGFDLGFEWAGIKTIWQVEIDEYCRRLLELRFPGARRYDDIRAFALAGNNGKWGWPGNDGNGPGPEAAPCSEAWITPDIISGGFPCQPVSHAGKRQGAADDRYLWPEMFRVVRTLRPRWVVAENVYGLITHEGGELLDKVYNDLESEGYETLPPIVLPACAFGAPHRRDRVWIVAHRIEPGLEERITERGIGSRTPSASQGEAVELRSALCHSAQELLDGSGKPRQRWRAESSDSDWWAVEPAVGRVAHGILRRVDRLRGLGNAIVPEIAYLIGRLILECEPCQR